MSDLLIDLPYHKRWWLPDRRHQYNSVLYGDWFQLSVIDALTGRITHSHRVKIDPEGKWQDQIELYKELCNKRFPKPLRHKSNEVK